MTTTEIRNELRKLFDELSELQQEREAEEGRPDEEINKQEDIVRQCIIDTAAWFINEVKP